MGAHINLQCEANLWKFCKIEQNRYELAELSTLDLLEDGGIGNVP